MLETSKMTAPIRLNIAVVVYCTHKYKVENDCHIVLYIYISQSEVQQTILENDRTSAPIIRFSEFLGIGYFGDRKQRVIAPIFDSHSNAERGWKKVMANQQQQQVVPLFHTVFVEHAAR
jgi:hypothetical protein